MNSTKLKPDSWNELITIKHEIIGEMHAFKNETAKLRLLNDWLRRELDLESRYQGLLAEAERLINERNDRDGQQMPEPVPGDAGEQTSQRIGAKERASAYRTAYVVREKRRGKNLIKVRSAYYRNDVGVIVGITYSSEKKLKKDAWFLNLQDKQFQEAVLLCETGPNSAQAIHLTAPFFEKYGRTLSKDEKRQVKFNVLRLHGRFYLQIPEPVGSVDVTEYVDGEPLICSPGSTV